MRGKLIVLYGIDGSGKSTILNKLKESEINNTICTSCMTNSVFEEELYSAEKQLHFNRRDYFSKEFKHMLHIGSVIYKMYNDIIPILNNGKNVILDRYIMCISLFTNIFLDKSYSCISKALECLPSPDLGIYFDVEIDTAVKRIKKRNEINGTSLHYSERKDSLVLKKEQYESLIPYEEYTILKIDANQEINTVYSSVLEILKKYNF